MNHVSTKLGFYTVPVVRPRTTAEVRVQEPRVDFYFPKDVRRDPSTPWTPLRMTQKLLFTETLLDY